MKKTIFILTFLLMSTIWCDAQSKTRKHEPDRDSASIHVTKSLRSDSDIYYVHYSPKVVKGKIYPGGVKRYSFKKNTVGDADTAKRRTWKYIKNKK